MNILNNLLTLLVSTRLKAFYWMSFYMVVAGFIDLLLQNLTVLDLPTWAVIAVGGLLTQISKGLKNKGDGKLMGFAETNYAK